MNRDEGAKDGHSGVEAPADSEDVSYLRALLGSPFVQWVLAEPTDALTPAQQQIASGLAQILRAWISKDPSLPVEHVIPELARYHEPAGTTLINYARACAGGGMPHAEEVPGDRLLNAFFGFAVECYGELLLPGGPFRGSGPDFFHYVRTPAGEALVNAIIAEGIFPLRPEASASAEIYMRSVQPGSFAHGLMWAAWNAAKFKHGTPSIGQLLDAIPEVLAELRSYLSGTPTEVPAFASLTGVRLPDGVEISGAWGRIRQARPDDHPPAVKELAANRTVTTTEQGERIEISDAGDVIFECAVRVQFELGADGNSWSGRSIDDPGDLVDRVRLAFALAVSRPARPVLYCMWMSVVFPTGNFDPRPLTDPRFMVMRIPTLPTDEEITAWRRWIEILMAADMSSLKLAVTRTLRAMNERLDVQDRLIDAVIAWESLFGGTLESTLRVSASLARLLHPAGEEREAAEKSYRKIYQARSDIVHANRTKTSESQLNDYGKKAIDATLQAVGILLTTHSHLLVVESSARSTMVLLGADEIASPSAAEDPEGSDPTNEL